jgi:4-hydroxy-tetrahydrodipicolinate synthase
MARVDLGDRQTQECLVDAEVGPEGDGAQMVEHRARLRRPSRLHVGALDFLQFSPLIADSDGYMPATTRIEDVGGVDPELGRNLGSERPCPVAWRGHDHDAVIRAGKMERLAGRSIGSCLPQRPLQTLGGRSVASRDRLSAPRRSHDQDGEDVDGCEQLVFEELVRRVCSHVGLAGKQIPEDLPLSASIDPLHQLLLVDGQSGSVRRRSHQLHRFVGQRGVGVGKPKEAEKPVVEPHRRTYASSHADRLVHWNSDRFCHCLDAEPSGPCEASLRAAPGENELLANVVDRGIVSAVGEKTSRPVLHRHGTAGAARQRVDYPLQLAHLRECTGGRATFVRRLAGGLRQQSTVAAKRCGYVRTMALDGFSPTGVYAACVTPFRDDESLDLDRLALHIDYMICSGINGVMVVGGCGEYANLTPEERRTVTTEAVPAAGADAVLVLPPYYIKPSFDGVLQHYETIVKEAGVEVIVYNNPGRTGWPLSVQHLEELSDVPGLVAVKECERDAASISEKITRLADRLPLLSGDDDLGYSTLLLGSKGAIWASANLCPRLCVDLFQACVDQNVEKALGYHQKLLTIFNTWMLPNHPGPLKQAMALVGRSVGPARTPLAPMDDGQAEAMARVLQASAPVL